MKISPQSRGCAIVLSLALVVGVAPAAVADDVIPEAVVSLVAPGLLTLPAADGVRDITSFQVASDQPTSVAFTITSADGGTVYATPAAVELTEENALAATIEVPVAGLPAGSALITATPVSGSPVSVPLTVGSGQPTTVTQQLSRSTIYTWSGSKYPSVTATVSAVDETGENVPFAGKLVATTGNTVKSFSMSSKTGAAKVLVVKATSLPYGTAKVVSQVAGAGGPTVSSAAASLIVKSVAVTKTKIAASTSVYPAKDGYRDTATVRVSSSTTTSSTIPARGTVKVTRSGKTVKSWTLKSTKSWSASWDGRVSGKIVPGTYKVTVSIKGPEGATKTASTSVVVKNGKLVTRTTSKWVSAESVWKTFIALDSGRQGACGYLQAGRAGCYSYDLYYDSDFALWSEGAIAVPSTVRNAQKFGAAKSRITMRTSLISGTAVWAYGRVGDEGDRVGRVSRGDRNLGWTSLPSGTKKIVVSAGLGGYTDFITDKFKIEYQYKAMVY